LKALLMDRFKKELGWFVGDALALLAFIVIFPLLPMFMLFDEIREMHEEE